MKREYDFSKAEQGKFYRKGAVLQLPIYLDAKVQAQVERVARRGVDPTGPRGRDRHVDGDDGRRLCPACRADDGHRPQ